MSALTIFSEDAFSIGAECPTCGRVLKIQKTNVLKNADGFILRPPVICPCGQTYAAIANRRQQVGGAPATKVSFLRKMLIREFSALGDKGVRMAAVAKLTDQELLTEIATSDKDINVRKAAMEELTNPELLAELAKRRRPVAAPCSWCGAPVVPAYLNDLRHGLRYKPNLHGIYLCDRCRKPLDYLDMNRRALTMGGTLPTLIDGVVCRRSFLECGKLECTSCKVFPFVDGLD